MLNYKLLILLLSMTYNNTSGQQLLNIYQTVDIEKYQGKNFIFEGKIYYKDKIANDSWAVLGIVSLDKNGKQIKPPLYNQNAGDYYTENDWSSYEFKGKIDKNVKYLALTVAIAGTGSYYIDDFKFIIREGNNDIAIPLGNSDFENDSLSAWETLNLDNNTKLHLTTDKKFSGNQSLLIDNSSITGIKTFGNNSQIGKYTEANGIKLYYEIYGKGEPLLLLHGNNSSMSSFRNQLYELSKYYKVIALDSRGQGRSSFDNRKITYELMADDVNIFLDNLKLKNINVLGWSDGGNTAIILALQHPDKIKKMAIMGSVLYNNKDSVTDETNKLIHKQVKEMEDKHIPKTNMDYRLKILLLTEPHINPDSLENIKAPTLIMAGQHDVVKENHTILIAKKIPNSKLVIFKGAGHEAPEEIPQLFNETVLKFLQQTK